MIRSAQDVIAIAKARGFRLAVRPGPPIMPVLVCPRDSKARAEATETLLQALKAFRLEIIDILTKEAGDGAASHEG